MTFGVLLESVEWADDEIILISSRLAKRMERRDGLYRTFDWRRVSALNIHSQKHLFLLLDKPEFAYSNFLQVVLPRLAKPKTIVMMGVSTAPVSERAKQGALWSSGRKGRPWTLNLFEVNTTTGDSRAIGIGSAYTNKWIVEPDGHTVARIDWDPTKQRFSVLHRGEDDWTEIFSQSTGEYPRVGSITADRSELLMFGALDGPRSALWRLPTDGSGPQPLVHDTERDITVPVIDPHTLLVKGVWLEGIKPEVRWIDERARQQGEALRKTFGGANAHLVGRSADSSRVVAEVAEAWKPPTYYLVDYRRGTADIVGESYPGLAAARLPEAQATTYKARDGYEIPAYLTVPTDTEAKNLPMVVLPHDGPMERDQPSFDWLAQFLASRGYAVLQPQFRGSIGLGEEHARAGDRQWGGLTQNDITDGVQALVKRGVADARRLCIVGIGFGGYAALAGAAFTPELYNCAVSINGITDLPDLLGHVRIMWGRESNSLAFWTRHIGSRTETNLIALSPSRAADRIRAPILLIHGSKNTVAPLKQADLMAKALRTAGKPVRFIELPEEDHWLSRSDSRIRVLTEMEAFLAEHLRAKDGG